MANHGTPGRIIALALGYTPGQYKAWMEIGQAEDAYEFEHGAFFQGSHGTGPQDFVCRLEALKLYRGIAEAEARFADKLCTRMSKAMMKGDMFSVRWWLEKRVKEFSPKADGAPVAPPVKVVFYCPDNGRMPAGVA